MRNYFFAFLILLASVPVSSAQVRDSVNRFDKNGLRQGLWVRVDDEGRKVYQGRFIDDFPIGEFTYYYPDGRIKSLTRFYGNSSRAYTRLFSPEGIRVSAGKVIGENRDSTWIFYDGRDSVLSIENYKNGKKQGLSRTFYENGKVLQEKYYKEDVLDGPFKEFFDNGNLKMEFSYVSGLHEGDARFYFLSGKLNIEGKYLHDFKYGTWNFYEENGTLDWRVVFKRSAVIKSTRYNGLEQLYYADNIPKSICMYKNGMKNGPFTEYYDIGKVVVDTIPPRDEYPEDKKQVITGQKISRKGSYADDKLQGKVITYKEDGTVDKEETYNKGELVN